MFKERRRRCLLTPALAGALLLACAPRKNEPKLDASLPRAVRLVAAAERTLPRTITAVGTLAAEERADVSFKVPGRLSRFAVDLGSRAADGAVLAELEPTDYRLRRDSVRSALVQARSRLGLPAEGDVDDVEPEKTATVRQAAAKLEEAKAQLHRSQALLAEGLLSRSAFDVVEATFKVAESQYNDALEEVHNRRALLAQKRSDLALAEQQLKDTVLLAPFRGAVQQRRANIGEFLVAGAPVLTLVKVNPIRLRVDVPEREAKAVRKGQSVTVRVEGDTKAWTGAVARVSPALEESNRSLVVETEIANPNGELRPGSFARAEIAADAGTLALVVPASAIVVFAGIEKVLIVKGGKAVEHPVVTGRRTGELVEVVSGLAPGERVVERPGNLATGMPVTPENEAAGAPASGSPGRSAD